MVVTSKTPAAAAGGARDGRANSKSPGAGRSALVLATASNMKAGGSGGNPTAGGTNERRVRIDAPIDPVKREKARALAHQMWEAQQRIPITRRSGDRSRSRSRERRARDVHGAVGHAPSRDRDRDRLDAELELGVDDADADWDDYALRRLAHRDRQRRAEERARERTRVGPSIDFNARLTVAPLPRDVLQRLSTDNVQVQPKRR